MGNSFRQTVAGIFARQEMNSSVMLSGHIQATMERASASDGEYLIAAQDTTYYNYSGHKKMSGLGVIQGNVRGLMQHNVLLINQQGIPLVPRTANNCDYSEEQRLADISPAKWLSQGLIKEVNKSKNTLFEFFSGGEVATF